MVLVNGSAKHNGNGIVSASGGHAPQMPSGSSANGAEYSVLDIFGAAPQMSEKASRRRFTNAYKLSIIAAVDACTDRGQVGALLRKEGLFYSTLANFRKQKIQGLLNGSAPKARSSKNPDVIKAQSQQTELERENRALRRKLAHAEKIITIQKKAAILLGETLQEMDLEEMD
jgi:transposase